MPSTRAPELGTCLAPRAPEPGPCLAPSAPGSDDAYPQSALPRMMFARSLASEDRALQRGIVRVEECGGGDVPVGLTGHRNNAMAIRLLRPLFVLPTHNTAPVLLAYCIRPCSIAVTTATTAARQAYTFALVLVRVRVPEPLPVPGACGVCACACVRADATSSRRGMRPSGSETARPRY